MKKILAIMAAACAMSAFADFTTQETFEGCTVGTPFELNPYYWTCEGDLEDLLTIEATDGSAYAEECGYPAANSTHDKALKIDGASKDKPLYYYSQAREEGGDPQPVDIGQGIYLDTMVNFTVTDEIDQQVETGSKLALFLYSAEDSDTTNLVFRAGYYSTTANDIIPTNYVMKGSVEAGKWYRLTVKAINTGKAYGFVPYLDGQVLEYENADAGVAGSLIDDLNSVAAKYYTTDKKSLLPCLFETGMYAGKIVSCGFVGTGLVDDLTFTDVAPAFAADATSVTIKWGEGVASVTVDDKTIEGESPFVMELPAGKTTIMVTAKAAEGYVLAGWTDGEKPVKSGDTIEIKAFQPAFQVGDKYFPAGTMSDAIVAAIDAGETLKLLAPCTEMIYVQDGTLVLDLAGQTIETTELCDATIYLDNANIEIINSTTQVGHIAAAPEECPAIYCDGDESSATIRGGIIDGAIDGYAIFFGGSVIKLEDDFPFELGDPDTLKVVEEDGYWVIKQEGVETFTVTFDFANGEDPIECKVDAGTPMADLKPEDPTWKGYTFAGWVPELDETVISNSYYTATWTKDEPSIIDPEEGDVEITGEGEEAVAVITPKEGVTEITINPPLGYIGKYEIPSTITKITGVEINNLIIKSNGFDIAPACKIAEDGVIALNEAATVTVGEEQIPVKPTLTEADDEVKPLAVGETTAVGVKAIPGLTYSLVRSEKIGGETTTVATETATKARVTLTDMFDGGKPASAFYVIQVEK